MTNSGLGVLGEDAYAIAADGMPADIAGHVRTLLVDTLGCLIGGLRYPPVRALAHELGPGRFGRIVTFGAAATWLDADSGGSFHPHGDRLPPVPTAHPAPHVLPVLLAQAVGRDDETLLRAFAAATELGMRLGAGSSLRPGLHPHGIHGPAGAAVAQALLAGGESATLTRAFVRGAALPLTATLAVPMRGGTVRNLWTGLGSYYGATAGSAAVDDTDHPDDEPGLLALFDGAPCDELDTDMLTGPDRHWQVRNSYIKPYACARWIHPACDALRLALGDRRGDEVASIDVRTFAYAASLGGTRPATDMAARFSLPFSLATLAIHGQIAAPQFLPDRLTSTALVTLADRIDIDEDPAFTAAVPHERPASVQVRFTDSTRAESSVRNARGNPDDPLSRGEVADKFRANVGDLLPNGLVDKVVEWLDTDPGTGTLLAHVAETIAEVLR